MESYQFLGLPQLQWQFINTFADWLSAIGTIAAVWISLWLARSATRPKAKLTATIVIRIGGGEPDTEFMSFQIVNTGDRPINVTNIGWRVGLPFMRRYAIQTTNGAQPGMNSPMPVDLMHGQQAAWYVDTLRVYQRETWAQDFAKKFMGPQFGIALFTLRAQAYTSTGHMFTVKPSDSLLKKLREAREQGVPDERPTEARN